MAVKTKKNTVARVSREPKANNQLSPQVADFMWSWFCMRMTEQLEKTRAEYEKSGNRFFILQAIQECGVARLPLPDWLCKAFDESMEHYWSAKAKDLGEAFHMMRPKGFHQNAAQKAWNKRFLVVKRVAHLRAEGNEIDEQLFAKVGRKFNVSGSTARDYYYSVTNYKKNRKLL